MDIVSALAIAAAAAAVFSLASGITSMAVGGEVNQHTSEQWMGWRVAFQAAALLFIVLAVIGSARAQTPSTLQHECIYDYQGISNHECRVYRLKVLKAKSEEERLALRNELHKVIATRTQRGMTPDSARGLTALYVK